MSKSALRAVSSIRRADLLAGRRGFVRISGNYGRYNQGPGSETKWFDTTLVATTISAAGAISSPSLNLIPEGTAESNRIGRKCTVRSVHMKGTVTLPSSSTPLNERIRIILYCDKQANGASATAPDIIEIASVNSFRNLSNVNRIKVLADKTFTFNQLAGAGADTTTDIYSPVVRSFAFNKRLALDLEFSSNTGAITEIRSNNIGVLAITDSGLATIAYTARVRFQG